VPQFIWVPEVRKVREEKYFYSANPEQYAVARDALNSNFYHLSAYGGAPPAHGEPGAASASQALGGGSAVPPAH